jgi:hypothetical protein
MTDKAAQACKGDEMNDPFTPDARRLLLAIECALRLLDSETSRPGSRLREQSGSAARIYYSVTAAARRLDHQSLGYRSVAARLRVLHSQLWRSENAYNESELNSISRRGRS